MYYNILEDKIFDEKKEFLELLKSNSYFTIEVRHYNHDFFIDYDLPIPNLVRQDKGLYRIIYIVDGYFGTKKGREYFSDVREKVSSTLGGTYVPYCIFNIYRGDKLNFNKCNLSDFEHLESKKKLKKRLSKENENREHLFKLIGEDNLFENVRWKIYQTKIDGTISESRSLEILEETSKQLNSSKSFSDLRSKAKNITQWTIDNYEPGQHSPDYWKYYYKKRKVKDNRMSKEEQLKIISEQKKLRTQEKILKGVKELLKSEDKFNKTNLSKYSEVSRKTLLKYEELFKDFL